MTYPRQITTIVPLTLSVLQSSVPMCESGYLAPVSAGIVHEHRAKAHSRNMSLDRTLNDPTMLLSLTSNLRADYSKIYVASHGL